MTPPIPPSALDILPDAVLNTFMDLVHRDSPPGKESVVCEYLQRRLNTLRVPYRVDGEGNLIAEIDKHRCDHDSVLVLCAHMDVVPPSEGVVPQVAGSGNDRIITSDGTTVLGGDDKAAIAPLLETLSQLITHQLPRPKLRLIFTTQEESTLRGAKMVAQEDLTAGFGLVFDVAADNPAGFGAIIHKAPTLAEFDITFKGRTAHAGMNPENGIDAIRLASTVIGQLATGRLDADTTANIGTITGGRSANVVPDEVVIKGEVRSHDPDRVVAYMETLQTVLAAAKANQPGADYSLRHYILFHRFELPQTHPGIVRVKAAMETIGLHPQFVATNGGSDANVLNYRGLPCVVLAAAYRDPHALTEQVYLADMVQSARLMQALINAFAAAPFSY